VLVHMVIGVVCIHDSTVTPPVITQGLTDEGGKVGGVVTFYCKATGNPVPIVDCYKNKKRLRGVRFQVVDAVGASVLWIAALRLDHENEQTIVSEVTNEDGTATVFIALIIN